MKPVGIIFLLSAIFLPLTSLANSPDIIWDKIRFNELDKNHDYEISSGTGFYINDYHIVTSKHVVQNCVNIAVRGDEIKPHIVELFNQYENADLALLKSQMKPRSTPYLRKNFDSVKVGDRISTIGYPLDAAQTGKYVAKSEEVTAIKDDEISGYKSIEFTNKIDHGNSGGPILDGNSNIIGIVTSKVTYQDSKTNMKETFGKGLFIDALIDYLNKYRIRYQILTSYDVLENFRTDFDARIYVVNIHCIKERTKN